MNTVSILVPVYNVEKYIERCARSLFEQTYQNVNYIFVDDCSTDTSITILKDILDNYPERKNNVLIIKHDKNIGLAAARNTAVENCHTDFLMHVDSDDYLEQDVLEKCMSKQSETNSDIVTISVKNLKKNTLSVKKELWTRNKELMILRLIRHQVGNGVCQRLIRTSLYKDNQIKVEVGRGMAEDLQVSPRLFYFAKHIEFCDDAFYIYNRSNEDSYTSHFSIRNFYDSLEALKVLNTFFEYHDNSYCDAINERKYRTIVEGLINCLKADGSLKNYNEIRGLYKKMDKHYYSCLNKTEKIFLVTKDIYSAAKIYVKLGSFIKMLFRRAHFFQCV